MNRSDYFGREIIRNFDVTIDLNNAMFRIRNPERKYVTKPVNLIRALEECKAPVFLSRRMKLKAYEAENESLRMMNSKELSDNKQVGVVLKPNIQSAAILGRLYLIKKGGLCVSLFLNTLDTPIAIQRGSKLEYAFPVETRYEKTENI